MHRAIGIVAISLLGGSAAAMAGDASGERCKAEIVAKADSLFQQRYVHPADKPLVEFDKNRESRAPDAVTYLFKRNYVVRLIFAMDSSLARIELFPEPMLYADSWASVPDDVELGPGDRQRLVDAASQLRPLGKPVSVHQPPGACFQSGGNLYCTDGYEFANVSSYHRELLPDRMPPTIATRQVTVAYRQSVNGSVSDLKAVSEDERLFKVGSRWYQVVKGRDPTLFDRAGVGSIVSLTTFGCSGNELACGAFPKALAFPAH